MALCGLQSQGLLSVTDHEREFMWAILAAGTGHGGLEQELRRCVRERGWQIPDIAAVMPRTQTSPQ
jgi:hypothetical protein